MISTKEFLKDKTQFGTYGNMYKREDVSKKMIEFAKLHVKAALEAASGKAELEGDEGSDFSYISVDKDSILNAYPLENIK